MKKIIIASITAVVVITVLAGTLIPVLDDATATHKTFSNVEDSIAYYDEIGENDYTFVWDPTTPTIATINGEEVALPDVSGYTNGVSLIVSEGIALRYYVSGGTYYIQSLGGGKSSGQYGYATSNSESAITISITDGVWSYSNNTNTYTLTGSTYIISDSGDYVMKTPSSSAYVKSDSSTAALGVTVISGVWVIMGWNLDSGITITPAEYYPPDDYTISNVVVHYDDVSGYDEIYGLSKVTFTAVKADDTTVTSNVTYSYFIVPAEVTAEKTVHFTDGENAIFNTIPVIVIVALLLAVLAMVLRSRTE